MDENQNPQTDEKLKSWVKKQLDTAVRELLALGVYESVVVEARPVWVFPFSLLIGKIREQDQVTGFDWFISGDFPTEMAPSSLASTPREAARHFALKWQLQANRQSEAEAGTLTEQETDAGESSVNSQLVKRAESLYELVDQDGFWQE